MECGWWKNISPNLSTGFFTEKVCLSVPEAGQSKKFFSAGRTLIGNFHLIPLLPLSPNFF